MRTEVKLITPELAKMYLERNKTNRKIHQKTVDFYASQMERNMWKLTGQGISFDVNNYLLDGQHRLQAIVKSRKSVKMLVIFDVDGESFEVYDSGKNRSVSDVFYLQGIKNNSKVSSIIQNYFMFCKTQKIFRNNRMKEFHITKNDILQKYYEHENDWQIITAFTQVLYRKLRLISESVIGGFISFLVFEKQKDINSVFDFFNQLYGIENDKFTCTEVLRNTLIKDALSTKNIDLSNKVLLLIKTWNYYVQGRDIKILKIEKDEKYPDIL